MCEDVAKQKVTRDKHGRFVFDGKVLSDSAIEQRLRRAITTKKSGSIPMGVGAQKMFNDLDQRPHLIQMFKNANLDKAGPVTFLGFAWLIDHSD